MRLLLIIICLAIISALVNARASIPKYIQYDRVFNPSVDGCHGAKMDDENSNIIRDKKGVYHLQLRFDCSEET